MIVFSPDTRQRPGDLLAVAVITLTAIIIAWPVISGGYLTYLDNPVHFAELNAAAFEARNGWSDIAFCGFPIGTLHSPLWYGAMAKLVRTGVPAGCLYSAALLLGFLAPPIALYYIARRRVGPIPATLLAYVLLVQRTAIVGIGSALGGMWTYYLAAAGVILLIDRLSRPCRSGKDIASIAVLTGLIFVTHLFPIVPIGLLVLFHIAAGVSKRPLQPGTLLKQGGGVLIGMSLSAVYWLPLFLAGEQTARSPQHLSGLMIVARLLFPTHLFYLLNDTFPALRPAMLVEAVPMIGLVLAGIAGTAFLRRRTDDAPLHAALLAASILVLLTLAAPILDLRILGPVSWRLLYFVRIALAIAALPFVAAIASRVNLSPRRPMVAVLSILALLSGFWWSRPIASVVSDPAGAEMKEVRELWNWLADNHDDRWGRVYLQDTFTTPGSPTGLAQSHVLSLTSHETGVRQLGPCYGVAPYRTASWTPSEFGALYRRTIVGEKGVNTLIRLMNLSSATHLVLSDAATRAELTESARFESLYRTGRFEVLRLRNPGPLWAASLSGGAGATVPLFETGRIEVELESGYGGDDLMVGTSYHPGWRITGSDRALLRPDGSGLLRVEGLEPGAGKIELEFVPSRIPLWITLVGCLGVLALLFVRGRR